MEHSRKSCIDKGLYPLSLNGCSTISLIISDKPHHHLVIEGLPRGLMIGLQNIAVCLGNMGLEGVAGLLVKLSTLPDLCLHERMLCLQIGLCTYRVYIM